MQGRRCADCGKVSVLSAEEGRACPFCGGQGGESLSLSGLGRLISWTVIRVAPGRYAGEAPYAVGLVELAEGLRLTVRVDAAPDRLSAGQALKIVSVDPARGPVFSAE